MDWARGSKDGGELVGLPVGVRVGVRLGFAHEDMEFVAFGFEASRSADFVADGDEFWDGDGLGFARVHIDEEGVSGLTNGELVVGLLAVEEDMLDDACGFEEFEGSVDRRFGNGVALFFEGIEELVCFE